MPLNNAIQQIIDAAIKAPSGDNSQPWRFSASPHGISIFVDRSRAGSLYDYRDRGAHLAIGAAIQNMLISAEGFGYAAELNVLPNARDTDLVASLQLTPVPPRVHPLFECITARASNRKPYDARPLSDQQRASLLMTTAEVGMHAGRIILVEDPLQLEQLARAATANERIAFGNKVVHHSLLGEMNWTEREDQQRRHGMYAKTLELSPPQLVMLRLVRHWPMMRALNMIGFSKLVCMENAKSWKRASAYCAIVMDDVKGESFVQAGRLMQLLWLKAVSMGMCAHPLGGIAVLGNRVAEGDYGPLSPRHVTLIRQAIEKIRSLMGINNGETLAMLLRIGYGGEPSARSCRLPPEVTYEGDDKHG